MEYTEEQRQLFLAEFQRRLKRRKITSITIISLLIGILILSFPHFILFGIPKSVWGPWYVFAIVAGLVFIIVDWRCPACNGILGDFLSTKYCSKCGFKFEETNHE